MSLVIAVFCDATLVALRNSVPKSRADILNLSTSGWSLQWDGNVFSWVAAAVAMVIAAVAYDTGSVLLLVAAIVVGVGGMLIDPSLGPPSTDGAQVTHDVIRLPGRAQSGRAEVPLSSVVDVWVDPKPYLLPDIGDITVQCGPAEYLHFPGVRHAETMRRKILMRRDRALARRNLGPPDGSDETRVA